MTHAELAELHAECFTHPRPWTQTEFASVLGMPHTFLMTQQGGFLVGRAAGGEAELLTLAVPKHSRRQGIARLLVENFLHQIALMGAQSAFLEVATGNAPALALYGGLGFHEVAERQAYMRGTDGTTRDAYIMRCDLELGDMLHDDA